MARGDYLAKTGGGYGKSYQQKTDNLKQSISSLDRRINKAIESGDTDQAKDLRSRQKNFVKDLAMNTVKQEVFGGDTGLTIQGIKTSSGNPVLSTRGSELYQSGIDRDFLNPTRRLQNQFPAEMKRMYPITTALQKGPFAVQAIKNMFGIEDKPIPYSGDGIMPAIRYPLEQSSFDPLTREGGENMAAAEGAGIFSNEGDFATPMARAEAPFELVNVGGLNLEPTIDMNELINRGQGIFENFQQVIPEGLNLNIGDKSLNYKRNLFGLPGQFSFGVSPGQMSLGYEI
tara:strand:+ start:880 stop:1740 length:861 start_codon:yes stop_codon:yes gene_type:complete